MAITRVGKGFGFNNKLSQFDSFKIDAPKVIANNSKNWFLEGFRKGGGQTDDSKSGWEPRKNNIDPGRGVLIGKGTGHLRQSIQVLKQTFKDIEIGTQRIPYADRHNEGLKGMPKREFIGDSKEMNASNEKLLANLISKIFK